MRHKNIFRLLACSGMVLSLLGCNKDSAPAPTPPLVLQGVAAKGWAIPLANVYIKCAGGGQSVVTTQIDGSFQATMDTTASLPCVLKVNDPMGDLFSFVETGSGTLTTNITPLTNMQLALASGADGSIFYNKFAGGFLPGTKGKKMDDAYQEMLIAFSPIVDLSTVGSFVSGNLIAAVQSNGQSSGQAGNSYDKKLDAILKALNSRAKSYSDFTSDMLVAQGENRTLGGTGTSVGPVFWNSPLIPPVGTGTNTPTTPTTPGQAPAQPGTTGGGTTVGVTGAAQTITFTVPATLGLSSSPTTLTATATSGLPVMISSTTPAICTVSGVSLNTIAPGTCLLVANQTGNSVYAAAPTVNQSIVLSKKAQTITFPAVGDQAVQGTPPDLYAVSDSGLAVTIWSATTPVCRVTNNKILTLVGAGTCTLNADQAGNATWAAGSATQSFNVSNANQTISFSNPGNQTLLNASLSLSASSSSNLTVTITSSTPTICTVNGMTASLLQVGTCTLTATQPGNSSYSAAPSVTRTFSVNLASQTIAVTIPGNITVNASPVTVSISATSGLPVTTTSMTSSICSISGNIVTIYGPGSCSLVNNQSGNGIYAAAPTVITNFTIQP